MDKESEMKLDEEFVLDLRETYAEIRSEIEERLIKFKEVWEKGEDRDILLELFFCILTPQSKALTCWDAVEGMVCSDIVIKGDYEDVLKAVGNVRFKYRKATFITEARKRFVKDGIIDIKEQISSLGPPFEARRWLAKNIKGLGYKEASHFLRNIGHGDELAILDRHILKNLARAGVIEEIPTSMTERRYLEIESRMRTFSEKIDIPLSHLDLLLWYREAGSVFK